MDVILGTKKYAEGTNVEVANKEKALTVILDYVKSYSWLPKEGLTREKVIFFIHSGYDYGKTATYFNVSVLSVRCLVSKWAAKLESCIGKQTIDLILENKIEEAMKVFRVSTSTVVTANLLSYEVVKDLPQPKLEAGIDIGVCGRELATLSIYSLVAIQKRLKVLDTSKLAYILYILESDDSSYNAERALINELFVGNIPLNELDARLAALKVKNIYT